MEIINNNSKLNTNINLFPQLAKLKIPTLVIHGRQDIIPLWTAQKIKKTLPYAQILLLEQCGHFPYIEKPEQLFTEINRFTSSLVTGYQPPTSTVCSATTDCKSSNF